MRTLAGWCVRHRRVVVLLWLAVLVSSIAIVSSVGTSYSNNFQFPHTQSFDAINLLKSVAPVAFGGHRGSRLRNVRERQADRPQRRLAHQQVGGRDQQAAQRDARDDSLRCVGQPGQHDRYQRQPDGWVLPGPLRQAVEQHRAYRSQELRRHGDQDVGRRADRLRHRTAGRERQQPVVQQHRARGAPRPDRAAARLRLRLRRPPPDHLGACSRWEPPSASSACSAMSSGCPRSRPN